jgi:hypothetical protein
MHRVGGQLLARAALPQDQDVAVQGGHFANGAKHFLDGGADPDHFPPAVQGAQTGLQAAVLFPQTLALQGLLDQMADHFKLEGLGHVMEGPLFHGLDGRVQGGVSGDQDHLGGTAVVPRLPQHIQAVRLPLQFQIRYDHVDVLIPQHVDGILPRVDGERLDRQPAEGLDNAVGMVPLIVHNHHNRSLFRHKILTAV